jgi:uncharacterized membrane protein (UPF0127 family)
MAWLVREGDVLAAAEVAGTRRDRRRGLRGREHLDGAFVIRPCRNVHTVGMRFPVDVAFCDHDGVVVRSCCLRPWRLSPLVLRAALVIEAPAGAFDRWNLRVGDKVEVKQ